MRTQTHRHVFFADADGPDAGAEWRCECGLVAVREGSSQDDRLVVISVPAPRDEDALAGDVEPLLERVLEGLASATAPRRSA
ncbi:hypothetical protein Q6348_13115 [Isoptericola sp. b441]|uniref:Uncharacterized protein n=1 Tax=Actinotalea lenta TaxID=3064654 RepID=A0ABT9DBA3_9CELL|nr:MULTISPECIES: hypothetical protein [unclassified Isoptericola]MDO8108136.1 hypothetical protein [Isoptericola sp. b441]MDO8120194.1 hypothetical protein [Isoptericola sp. b490]